MNRLSLGDFVLPGSHDLPETSMNEDRLFSGEKAMSGQPGSFVNGAYTDIQGKRPSGARATLELYGHCGPPHGSAALGFC